MKDIPGRNCVRDRRHFHLYMCRLVVGKTGISGAVRDKEDGGYTRIYSIVVLLYSEKASLPILSRYGDETVNPVILAANKDLSLI